MRPTIEELMKQVNCTNWPQKWSEIYDIAMNDFEQNGCPLSNPEYYDHIGNKYNILIKYRDLYKKAAKEISNSPALSAFLSLLTFALKDRDHVEEFLANYEAPKAPDGKPNIAYDLISALAMCGLADICHENLKKRNLPDDIILSVMQDPEKGIDEYAKRNNGNYGYHLLDWYQKDIDAKLFKIGSLSIELFASFPNTAVVFENKNGEHITLANDIVLHKSGCALGTKYFEDTEDSRTATVTETNTAWKGFAYTESGNVSEKEVVLSKSDWEKVISPGDPVISIHIPANCNFSSEVLDKTFTEIKEFMNKYFPDYNYKAIYCHSWLLDPQLEHLLSSETNIVKFGKRFQRMTRKSAGTDVFYFVFLKPFGETNLSDCEPKTKLEKALVKHFEEGKTIYELSGFFIL